MKLYEIHVGHYGPKSQWEGTCRYAIAPDDGVMLCKVDEVFNCGWADDTDMYDRYDDRFEHIGQETRSEAMLRVRGDYNWDEADYSDPYYGVTLYGWDEGRKIKPEDAETLIRLGIALDWRPNED